MDDIKTNTVHNHALPSKVAEEEKRSVEDIIETNRDAEDDPQEISEELLVSPSTCRM
jgi:hypothetical protein